MEADQLPADAGPREEPGPTRRARVRSAAAARGVPLPTILVTVAVVVLTYLAGKLAYRLRDVLLLMVVAGSIPCAAALQVIVRELWQATEPGSPPS